MKTINIETSHTSLTSALKWAKPQLLYSFEVKFDAGVIDRGGAGWHGCNEAFTTAEGNVWYAHRSSLGIDVIKQHKPHDYVWSRHKLLYHLVGRVYRDGKTIALEVSEAAYTLEQAKELKACLRQAEALGARYWFSPVF